ncbi:MAG: MarR family winged helix-turn-helix transcriptional regulator [Candidatus Binataceae bacterium]
MTNYLSKRPGKPARTNSSEPVRRTSPAAEAIFDLFWQIPFTYFRLKAMGDRLSAPFGLSPGKISLMRSLATAGPQSVAQIARSRPVSRQGVQQIADQLAGEGFLEYVENPTHRRAQLARITPAGEKAMRRMLDQQRKEAAAIAGHFSERSVRTAIAVLGQLSERLNAGGSSD